MKLCPFCSKGIVGQVIRKDENFYECPVCKALFNPEEYEKISDFVPGTEYPRSCPGLVFASINADGSFKTVDDGSGNTIAVARNISSCSLIETGVYKYTLSIDAPHNKYAVEVMAEGTSDTMVFAGEFNEDLSEKTINSFIVRAFGTKKSLSEQSGYNPINAPLWVKASW